jgi:hypothetical protein
MVMFQSHWKVATNTKKRTMPSGMIKKSDSMVILGKILEIHCCIYVRAVAPAEGSVLLAFFVLP